MAKILFYFNDGECVDIFVLIKGAEVRTASNGKKFIAFNFADKSGEISAKYWDASEEDIKQFTPGTVVKLNGKRDRYKDNPQIKIFGIRPAKEGEPADPKLYLQAAPEDAKSMEEEFRQFVAKIDNPDWQKIVRDLLNKFYHRFFTYPAAKKNHHAFESGLAYHTLSILRLAQSVVKQYGSGINASLLYAGAILHDLGKTIELSGPVATTYTLEGNLLGHIVLVDEEIVKVCQKEGIDTEKEDVVLLRHTIISHHGLLEYGSPVTPHLLEADILHQLDELDASIQMLRTVNQHTEPGEFSERVFAKDGRKFYHPHDFDSEGNPINK